MKEELDLRDFDVLGIIELDDIQGIEKYVTPIMPGSINAIVVYKINFALSLFFVNLYINIQILLNTQMGKIVNMKKSTQSLLKITLLHLLKF